MRVWCSPVPAAWRHDVSHLIRLFFDGAEVQFENPPPGVEVELQIEVQVEEARVCATVRARGQKALALEEKVEAGETRQALKRALLLALEQWTGQVQPWGILTGVRPLKLFHNRLREGKKPQEIRLELERRYLIRPEKTGLMERIARQQCQALPDLYRLREQVSLYIGIPFCPTKCAYCTFPAYSIRGRSGSVNDFLAALHREVEVLGQWLKAQGIKVTSIYLGGGTPTSISAEELDALLLAMSRHLPDGGASRELTVEAGRPDTITPEKLEVMRRWGVQRISINPQSFTQETLVAIGRHHTVEETIEKYHLAQSMGFHNINMDLIIGLPGEGLSDYQRSLEGVDRLRPASLTVHTLSFKRASHMTQNRERYPVATSQEVAEMVALTQRWTAERGYAPYYLYRQKNILGNQENVGYALEGRESLYNILIMEEQQTILGLGCGASSKIISPHTSKIAHYANPKEPRAYTLQVEEAIRRKLELLEAAFGSPAAARQIG